MAKSLHIEPLSARDRSDFSLKNNFPTENLKIKRRSLRYEQPAIKHHEKKPLTARNTIDNSLPPSFYLKNQTKRANRMFHADKTLKSLSRST